MPYRGTELVLHFGKYKGYPIHKVISMDMEYIEWLLVQDWTDPSLASTIQNIMVSDFKKKQKTCSRHKS